ncbi:lipid-transfer protein [Cupriavidus numazuensis]|uniref:propanoyl-CoA C-acyltransferase n=1 Tax=Cupriavidus numazuensis TaxID=221992 RepID=A0ABN7Q460_9BURK|nr:lipid-transfer protein [Cupriavidus numazuensis]CAG2156527.1 3-ketoacyl-CoA thiolase [Cupriavidus numazuensis]
MTRNVFVAGVGMIPFAKPGASAHYDEMGAQAISQALEDAGLSYADVQQAYAGYVYGDSTCGQAALYRVGLSGVPVVNVNNNCATGSSALFLARQAVQSGAVDCAIAVGFEEMQPGALASHWDDRPRAMSRTLAMVEHIQPDCELPGAIRMFAGAGLAHMEKYGTKLETFAKIRAKASRHAANNPLAIFRKVVTPEEVLAAPAVWEGVLTRLMACPPTCGAAAAIVVSEEFARKRGLRTDVFIAGQAMTTDKPDAFDNPSMIELVGVGMTKSASQAVYEQAGIGPDDIDVIELHDCFAQNELLTYEGLGLCKEGEGEQLVNDGDNTYGGKWVVNPSGGLLSKGHPLGATGLAQCYELVHQLRGTAGDRQVPGAKVALQHNLGLGGACVVTAFKKA